MADPPVDPARPSAPPGAGPARAPAARTGVPLSVWPAVPPPGRCPVSDGQDPCPARVTAIAVVMLVTAFSRPGDLVAAPDPATSGLVAVAAASAGRRALGVAAASPGPAAGPDPDCAWLQPGGPAALLRDRCRVAGQAALAVITACPAPCCDPAGAEGGADTGTEVLYAACQRILKPGGVLAVITTAARAPAGPAGVIARARAAGLVYAQHIIALHAPVRDSRLHRPPGPCPDGAHLPAHSDFLIFTTPGGPRHD